MSRSHLASQLSIHIPSVSCAWSRISGAARIWETDFSGFRLNRSARASIDWGPIAKSARVAAIFDQDALVWSTHLVLRCPIHRLVYNDCLYEEVPMRLSHTPSAQRLYLGDLVGLAILLSAP